VHACVGVLFSGGLDSTLLALIAGQLVATRPLDLLNVSFQIQEGGLNPII
jgi:asparagine synthetase B (glutamine-hydrolysing)